MLIQKYRDSWVDDFNKLKNLFTKNISSPDIRIEHIGSTAVKGLGAKPIIDIDIIFNGLDTFEIIKEDLEKLGYTHHGNQGIEGREVFKRKGNEPGHEIMDTIRHHLYVSHKDSKEWKKHLVFRDFLRNNKKERLKYEDLKYEIAEEANQDRKAYAKLKEVKARKFIESIIQMMKT